MKPPRIIKNKERARIEGAYKRLFNTADGRVVLEDMRLSFGGKTFDPNENVSNYRQGQRSVLDLIEELLNLEE